MKKKVFSLLTSLICVFGLVSCNNSSSNNQDKPEPVTPIEDNTPHDIIIAKSEHCSITTSKNNAVPGETIEVYINDIEEYYVVTNILVNDNPIEGNSFKMPKEDAYINVVINLDGKDHTAYTLNISPSKYAIITSDKESYEAGETVNLDYQCKGNYVLSHFSIDDNSISGTSFIMPNKNINVKGTFEYVFKDTDWQVSSTADILAKSFWYISYGDDGVYMTVMVDDRIVCGPNIAESELYRDNIDCIITKKIDEPNIITNHTFRLVIPAIGDANIQVGNNNSFKRVWLSPLLISYSSTLKYLDSKDGYNGYQINVFVSYEALNVSKEEAVDNITLAIAIRNQTHYGSTIWNSYSDNGVIWDNLTTHPIIRQNGSLLPR